MEIRLRVKTGSSQGDRVELLPDGSYLVHLRTKPIDGAANVALIKLLAKHFKVPKSAIAIKNGFNSHWKTVSIE